MRMNDDGKTVAAMDILAPGIGEIIGGSQREERLDMLEKRMEAMHLPKAPYEWCTDLRRYGTVPRAQMPWLHRPSIWTINADQPV